MSSDREITGSITRWISELRRDNPAAKEMIWIRFVSRLVHIAEQKLRNTACRVPDGDIIASAAFADFFERDPDDFEKLVDRNDLWQILVTITERRVIDMIRSEGAQKRGGGQIIGEGDLGTFSMLPGSSNAPDVELMMIEAFEDRLNSLKNPLLQQIAIGKMEGLTNDELAAKYEISSRSVERRLSEIRKKWQE